MEIKKVHNLSWFVKDVIDPRWRLARKCRNLQQRRGRGVRRGRGRRCDLRALMQCRRVIDHARKQLQLTPSPSPTSASQPPRLHCTPPQPTRAIYHPAYRPALTFAHARKDGTNYVSIINFIDKVWLTFSSIWFWIVSGSHKWYVILPFYRTKKNISFDCFIIMNDF